MKGGALPAGALREALAASHADLLGRYREIDPGTYDRAHAAITDGARLHLNRYELADLVPLPQGHPCDPWVLTEDDQLIPG